MFGKTKETKEFKQNDNRGTQHDTLQKATGYWISRMSMKHKDPFALYIFADQKTARDALLELPCIHIAKDTGNLICTEVLFYGVYPIDNKFEAVICGADLSHQLWEQAIDSFKRHGGIQKNELEPEFKPAAAQDDKKKIDLKAVKFLREDKVNDRFGTTIYRVYKGPDAKTAQEFLSNNPLRNLCIIL